MWELAISFLAGLSVGLLLGMLSLPSREKKSCTQDPPYYPLVFRDQNEILYEVDDLYDPRIWQEPSPSPPSKSAHGPNDHSPGISHPRQLVPPQYVRCVVPCHHTRDPSANSGYPLDAMS
jgi:hypothetical protein